MTGSGSEHGGKRRDEHPEEEPTAETSPELETYEDLDTIVSDGSTPAPTTDHDDIETAESAVDFDAVRERATHIDEEDEDGEDDDEAHRATAPDPRSLAADPVSDLETIEVARDHATRFGGADASLAGEPSSPDETLPGGIPALREQQTEHGAFAGSPDSREARSDDQDTLPEAGDSSELSRRQIRTERDVGSRASRRRRRQADASGTARDAVAGTAADRGTRPTGLPGPMDLKEGDLLADRYELVSRLGKGGMGEVWKARHTLLRGMRAVKLIKASISRDPSFRARFLAEGQTMMRVKHPGVVEVTDLDETRVNRELFMVMEHLDGRTLYDAFRDARDPLADDVRKAVRIFREVALGMQRIHDERIVHKDLKSDNVLLVVGDDGEEHPKVIDFGLAKRLDAEEPGIEADAPEPAGESPDLRTTLSGTLAYMAPEQFRGEPSSFQSDIYAFGVMFHECFTRGEFPLSRGGLRHYMKIHKEGTESVARLCAVRPDVDRFVTALADRCMHPDRASRPASFSEVAEQFQWWLDAPQRRRRRNRVLAIAGSFAALAAVAVVGFLSGGEPSISGQPGLLHQGRAVRPDGQGRFHLRAEQLAGISLYAEVNGSPDGPSVRIDGEAVAWDVTDADGRLNGRIDLSALPDGEHELAVRASSLGAATNVRVVVDRVPPVFRERRIVGAVGTFSSAANPQLTVWFEGTDTSELKGSVRQDGVAPFQAQRTEGGDSWQVTLPVERDGPVVVELRAEDLAGHLTVQEFTFERDTVLERPLVQGLAQGETSLASPRAAGTNLSLDVREPGLLVVTAAGQEVFSSQFAEPGAAAVPVPPIPSDGSVPVVAVFTDRAGNRGETRFDVRHVPDTAELTTADGRSSAAVTGAERLTLRITRTYPIDRRLNLLATPVRDAMGAPVAGAPVDAVDATFEQVGPKVFRVDLAERALAAGTYRLEMAGLGESRVTPLLLTVDDRQPVIEPGYRVVDAEGRDVPDGGWNRTRSCIVSVTVGDQSLASLELAGDPPRETLGPGRRVYTFAKTFEVEGPHSWALAAQDAAGNTAGTTVDVRADWTPPSIALTTPGPSSPAFNQLEPVEFAGTCSEDSYRLRVSGRKVRGGEQEYTLDKREFRVRVALDDDPVPLEVSLVAEDRAGNVSQVVTTRVRVEFQATESKPEITWSKGVTSVMRRVRAGDVVIGGRVHPVREVYLDRSEVTNAQYREFLAAVKAAGGARSPWAHPQQPSGWDHTPNAETWGDPRWSADELPVVNVAYWDAYAFAAWSGRRVPSEGEWVKAAAKDETRLDLRAWPPFGEDTWKDGVLVTREAFAQGQWQGPAPAGEGADVSPSLCLHMGGNVSEWVELPFARTGEPDIAVRGGNWFYSRSAANVRRVPPKGYARSSRAPTIGFRCALDAEKVHP